MAAAETSATTWWAGFRRSVKSFILEPKEELRAPQRTSSSSTFYSVENEEDNEESPPYEPATCTGFRELPTKTMFAIMLLWLPRFFIPWIAAWHDYNVLFLVDPKYVETHEKELFNEELILFCGKCGVTMFISFIAGILDTERFTYMILLILYTLCPVAGAYVDTVLRSRLIDTGLYSEWSMYIALMHWTMAIPFIFFPVQLSSIFYEKENMSRQAHYNWIAFFSFFEFINAYTAFWITPCRCPTTERMQIAVWIGIGLALYTAVLLTTIFFFVARAMTKELIDCLNSCIHGEEEPDESGSSCYMALKMTACYLCIFIPVIYTYFVFAVLQRFVPDEGWAEQKSFSATGMFYAGRPIGVAAMILLLTVIRTYGRKITRLRLLRSDVLALGLPHLFNTIALLILFIRFATLSHLNEGSIMTGPIRDDNETVVIFFNLIFRNRTVCVSSEHFRPVKIRPFSSATRKLLAPGIESIKFTVTPEPDSIPSVVTNYEMKNFSKGEWVAFSITLINYLAPEVDAETKLKNYYTKPRVIKQRINQTRPQQVPQVFIFNTYVENSETFTYGFKRERQSHPSDILDMQIKANEEGNAQLWKVSRPGNWSIRVQPVNESNSVAPWFDFNIDNSHSVYFLANYLYAPIKPKETWGSTVFHPPAWFKLFKVADVAGPSNSNLPSKQQLQWDTAIRTGLTLAGMAAGGVYVGVIYMFWIEPFISTTMRFTIMWVLIAVAEQAPKVKLIDIDWFVSSTLCDLQIVFTILHFSGALFLYRSKLNARIRSD